MKLDKILKITEELVSPEAATVVENLYHNPGYSEFDISEEVNMPINKIRSILYELKAKNLIDYDRRKDKEKGWYLYYWKVMPENYEIVYKNSKKKMLEQFREKLDEIENSSFYICPNFCRRLSFEDALDHNFTCPDCSTLMQEEQKDRKIRMLKRNIEEHEKLINEVY